MIIYQLEKYILIYWGNIFVKNMFVGIGLYEHENDCSKL